MLLSLYRLAWKLGSPLIDFYMWRRRKQGKEDDFRYEERLGIPSLPRPNSKLVWIHAASVGEAASVLPLIEVLVRSNAWVHVLVTTGTVSSAMLMEQRLPKRAFHQYVPIDKQEYVDEFIDYWQPDLAVWVESEFWPNLLSATYQWGCPVILLNGRISDESFKKWMKYPGFARQMIGYFDVVMPQSREDGHKFKEMGARAIRFTGNLKYGAPPLPYDEHRLAELKKMIGHRKVWVAASTHPGEEEAILEAHMRIKEKLYGCLTIVVPRHPRRGAALRDMMSEYCNVSMRSTNDRIMDDTDIYIADTMGEMGLFYRLADVVFIGGSLVPHGGHNPIEAAHLDSALVCGPNMQNFREIVNEFAKAGAIEFSRNGKELAHTVFELWHNPQKRVAMSRLSNKLVTAKQEILDNIVEEISAFL